METTDLSQCLDLKAELQEQASARYCLFYGARDPIDRAQAEHLRGVPGVQLFALEAANHEVTSHLLEEGTFMKPVVEFLETRELRPEKL